MAVNRRGPRKALSSVGGFAELYPMPIIAQAAPTVNDLAEVGTIWIDQAGNDVYILLEVVAAAATWTPIGAGAGVFDSVTSTTFVTAGTTITAGTGLIATTGGVTCSDWTTAGVITNSVLGVLQSNAMADGEVLIGSTAGVPMAATLTAGAGIAIGNAANAITITATGATAVQYTTDDANVVVPDGVGNVNVVGGVNVGTTGAIANTITINVDNAPTFTGLITGQLGLDISGAGCSIATVTNAADVIYLHANGGVNETIHLHADQGTAVDSIELQSDAGGVTITAGLNSADAINIDATDAAGGIDIDSGTGGIIVDTTGEISLDAAAASNFTVTGAGVDLTLESDAGTVIINSGEDTPQAIYLHADGGVTETIVAHADQSTAVNSVHLLSDLGGITLTATGNATDNAINVEANAGGIDMDAAMQININTTEDTNDSLVIGSTNGGIDITAAGADAGDNIDLLSARQITLTSTGNIAQSIYLHTNTGITETIQIHNDAGTDPLSIYALSDLGGITITATGLAAQNAVNITAGAGGVNTTSALDTVITSNHDDNAAVQIDATAGGIDIEAAGTDAGDNVDIASARQITLTSTGDIVDAIYLHTNSGTTEQIHLHCDQGTAVTSIDIASDDGGITLESGLVSDDSFNISSAGGVDVDADMQIHIQSNEDTNDSIVIYTADGGIDITAAGTDASDDIDISSARAVNINSTGNIANAIYLHANAGTTETINIHADQGNTDTSVHVHSDAGGVTINGGDGGTNGNIKLVPGTSAEAAGAVATTLNAKIGVCTFAGTTTAAGAQETFTITNDEVSATSGIIVTVANGGANDSRMSLEQVKPAAGSFEVKCQNNGGAQTNGDVIISFIVLN